MMKGGTEGRAVRRVPSRLRSCAALAAVGLFVSSSSTQLAYDQDLTSQTPRLEDAKTATSDAAESRDGAGSRLVAAVSENDLSTVRALLAGGVDPNTVDTDGTPVLVRAAENGRTSIVGALVVAGADISAKGMMGIEAIHEAALDGDLEMVELLLASGAEVDARDALGATPLMWAAQGGQVKTVRLLIVRGANVNARDDATRRAYFKAEFVGDTATMREIKRSGRLAFVIEDGASVLDHAKIEGNREVIRLLLAAGATRRR